MQSNSATLWIVATPLGNHEDLSPRARRTLADVDLVLAEDTRRAAKLFAKCGITVKKCISFFEHNEEQRGEFVISLLNSGKSVALISDAGTPLLADPGYRLVQACRAAKITVSPVPGPSAPTTALSAAGIAPIPYTFLGFLPRGKKARQDLFALYAAMPGSLIFFERRDRAQESLELASSLLGRRKLCICRELTKIHEEFVFGSLQDYDSLCQNLLGEITIIIGPAEEAVRTCEAEAIDILRQEFEQGVRTKQAAIAAATKCQGWTVSQLYDLASQLHLNSQN